MNDRQWQEIVNEKIDWDCKWICPECGARLCTAHIEKKIVVRKGQQMILINNK